MTLGRPHRNNITAERVCPGGGLLPLLAILFIGCLEYKTPKISGDAEVSSATDIVDEEATVSQCSSDVQCLGLSVPDCYRAVCRTGQCVAESDPVQANNPCSGATACDVGVCAIDGTCTDIVQTDCSGFDGVCVVGVCNPESGVCRAEPLDDQSACQLDICTSGTCQGGTCADLKASQGAPCSTGTPCRVEGVCDDLATCIETPDPACQCSVDSDCDDGLACTADTCLPDGSCSNQVSGSCVINGQCFFKDQPAPGNPCLVCDPSASATSWSLETCQDSDDCTLDTCEWGEGCRFDTVPQEGQACELPSCPGVSGTCQAGTCDVDCPYQCFVSNDCANIEGLELPNSCHAWSCDQNTCVALPDPTRVDDPCDSGDVCIVGATCTAEGDCVGTPFPCPAPACNIATCQASADNQPECSVALVDAGTACDDGSPCTAMDECDAAGACTGTTLDCSAYDSACLVGVCDGGLCTTETKGGAGAVQSCDDGNPCTGGDICQDGVCGFSAPCGCATNTACDDGNSCTFDICSAGQCTYEVQSGTCFIEGACYDDGVTLASSLCLVCDAEAAARRWTGRVCDDGESCTDDLCDAATGCVHVPDDDNVCTDGLDCSTDDQCKNGVCEATCECQSDEDCAWVVTGACEKPLCTAGFDCMAVPDPQTEGTACDDGLFCTVGDTCSSDGVCAGGPTDCTGADDTCLIGTCDDAADACIPVPAPDGTLCDDGDACTTGDSCTSAQCSGQPVECEGSEDGCNDATCVDGNCLPVPLTGNLCDDGEPCTVGDACDAGTCKGGWNSSDPHCGCGSDGNCSGLTTGCFEGKCDLSNNACFQVVVTEPIACDDGVSCTFEDTCIGGSCEGSPYACEDGIACTDDTCDGIGGCQFPLTAGQCLIEGVCVTDGQTQPANPCLICDSALAGQTWSPAPSGASCDDGDACSSGDGCDGAGSCVGIGYACPNADNLSCTLEACDPNSTGCVVTIAPNTCNIGGACYEADEASPTNPCQVCLPILSQTAWSAASKPCDDGIDCTHSDTCSGFSCIGTWYSCSDGKSCTADICTGDSECLNLLVPDACLIGDTCYGQGDVNPGNPCEICEATDVPNGWTAVEEGSPCDDGLPCTSDDSCTAGQCAGSSLCTPLPCENIVCETSDGCSVELTPGKCSIDGVCYSDGDQNPENVCQSCQPLVSTTAWTSTTGICDDGDPCTTPDTCVDGVCAGAPKADLSTCPVDNGGTLNGICDQGTCYAFQESYAASGGTGIAGGYRTAALTSDASQFWATYNVEDDICASNCSYDATADVISLSGSLIKPVTFTNTTGVPVAQHASGDFASVDSLVYELAGTSMSYFSAYPSDGSEDISALTQLRIATAASGQASASHLFTSDATAITTCVENATTWQCQTDSNAHPAASASGFVNVNASPYLFTSNGTEVQLVGLVDDNAPLSWSVVASTNSFGTVKTAVSNGTQAVAAGTFGMLVVFDGSQTTPTVTQLILPGGASQSSQASFGFLASTTFKNHFVLGGTRTFNNPVYSRRLSLLVAKADASAMSGNGWTETILIPSPPWLDVSCDSSCLAVRSIQGLAATPTSLLVVGTYRDANASPIERARWLLKL